MRYPMTASIILVQLDDSDSVKAYVRYGVSGDKEHTVSVDLTLSDMADAIDPQMWIQMCAASVCDAL